MKIYSFITAIAVCFLLISCSNDGFVPSPKKEFKPELDPSLYYKDSDSLPGEPVPPKGKG